LRTLSLPGRPGQPAGVNPLNLFAAAATNKCAATQAAPEAIGASPPSIPAPIRKDPPGLSPSGRVPLFRNIICRACRLPAKQRFVLMGVTTTAAAKTAEF